MKKAVLMDGEENLGILGVHQGTVREFGEMKAFGAFLARDVKLLRWWRRHMGYLKEDGDEYDPT